MTDTYDRTADLRQQPGVCRHGRPHGDDCGACDLSPDASPCTGQQPAQPESGEAWRSLPWFQFDAIRRLHAAHVASGLPLCNADKDRAVLIDALTAARQQIAPHKADAANAIARTDEIGRRLIEAQQREAELREALRKYGWHKPECDYMQESLPCTCGFMDAVKEPT
jgi:hypothetical protein